jgi:hypothetical protein
VNLPDLGFGYVTVPSWLLMVVVALLTYRLVEGLSQIPRVQGWMVALGQVMLRIGRRA